MALAYSPLLAAFFFFFGSILRIVAIVRYMNRSFYDAEEHQMLNPSYLKKEWQHRRDEAALISFSQFLNLMAWLLFAIPIMQLAWALSRGGRRKVRVHGAMFGFAVMGVLTELTSRLLVFGGKSSALWMSSTFNLAMWLPEDAGNGKPDNIGWRHLEITYLIMGGFTTFVDAFEWICLAVILALIAYSVASQENRELSIRWAYLGLVIAFFCVFDFASAIVLSMDHNTYTGFAVGISVINTLIFLPIWLWILAIQLPKALPRYTPALDTEPTLR